MSDQQTPPGGEPTNQPDQGSQNPYAAPQDGQQQAPPQQHSTYQQQDSGSSGSSGMAVAALIVGILSILLSFTVVGGFLLGITAIILGAIAANKVKKGQASGRGMAIGGIITGVIGFLIAGALTALTAFIFGSSGFGSFGECVSNADDQSQVEECEREFRDNLEERFGGGG